MKRTVLITGALVLVLTAGCVIRTEHTIDAHITLDIRHIEEQAEDVLDFIEGKSDVLPGLEAAPPSTSWLDRGLDHLSFFKTAWAEELKTASPRVSEIAVNLRERNAAIVALKEQGCLGENNRGYVELRECDGLADTEKRNAAQKLLAEENKDRKALYKELTRLNADQNVSVSLIEQVYALQRLQRGQRGEAFQLPEEGKEFEEFRQSALGKRLGEACQPGAWIRIP